MLDRGNAVFVVIDLQDRLLAKIPAAEQVTDQAIRLVRAARELEIPVLWTEQYPKGLGPTQAGLAAELDGCTPIEKTAFGCMGVPAFESALRSTGRGQLLITGVEAHVCVTQTALGALAAGYEVYVPRDGVASRVETECAAGLARMAAAGAHLATVEMALFELLRDAASPEFKKLLPLLK